MRALAAVVTIGVGYLLLWPVDADPERWQPSPALELPAGVVRRWTPDDVELLDVGGGGEPEDVARDRRGRLYTGLADGRVVRLDPDGSGGGEVVASTGGRPFGLAFSPVGTLWVADRDRGLLAVGSDGVVSLHLGSIRDGARLPGALHRANGVSVGPDGTVYVTDASDAGRDSSPADDIIEGRPRGRLLAYDPRTRSVRWSVDSLYFPNGVAVLPDGSGLLLSETSRYRVRILDLEGGLPGRWYVFADRLPGFPDGLHVDPEGTVWVALASNRSTLLDLLAPVPVLRNVLLRIPEWLRAGRAKSSMVLRYDRSGALLAAYESPGDLYAPITSVATSGPYLVLGSFRRPTLARARR